MSVTPCPNPHWRPAFGPFCTEFVNPGCWHFDNGATSKIDDVLTEQGGADQHKHTQSINTDIWAHHDMLDKDAFDIEKLRISCKVKFFQNKTCVKDPSIVTQKNEKIITTYFVHSNFSGDLN